MDAFAVQGMGGLLDLELGGLNAGQFDQLNVSGSATLNGGVKIALANSFSPGVGDRFQVLSCTSRSGVFSGTNIPAGISLSYSNSGVFLAVTGPVTVRPQLVLPKAANGQFTFSFTTANGQTYTVLKNDDLNSTNWVPYSKVTGNGGSAQITAPMTNGPQRCFRLRLDP